MYARFENSLPCDRGFAPPLFFCIYIFQLRLGGRDRSNRKRIVKCLKVESVHTCVGVCERDCIRATL